MLLSTVRYALLSVSIFFATSLPSQSQDGQQLYTLYCSACHGVDGMGANEGAFPPLAGSRWVTGNPKRSVAIVLHGLQGPIEVKGRSYNLAMPPQGAALKDKQIGAILNYVHNAWGNKGSKVRGDLIRITREEFADRKEMWTAPELLELFPLPEIQTPLKNLISRVYLGEWQTIPKFDELTAEAVEEEHVGLLSLDIAPRKNDFGIVWDADFHAPEAASYEFSLDATDGARLIIDTEVIASIGAEDTEGEKELQIGTKKLSAGPQKFRVEYFVGAGERNIKVAYRKTGEKDWQWISEQGPIAGPSPIPLNPKDGKAVIYRNFIEGTTPRAIAFGFPGNANLAYSADNLAPALLWNGSFIDAGRHWTERGQGNQAPSGETIYPIVQERYLPNSAKFKGYTLDVGNNPTFIISVGSGRLEDQWRPGPDESTLLRKLTLMGGEAINIPLGPKSVTAKESIRLVPDEAVEILYTIK